MRFGPIDYSDAFAGATPVQSVAQGYQLGAGIRADQQQQTLQTQQQEAQQAQQQVFATVANNPNASADDYARLMTLVPGAHEGLSKAWATKNSAQQEAGLSDALQWGSAIKSGRPEVAISAMNDRADAMERSRGPTGISIGPTPESQALRAQAQVIALHPELALGSLQAMISKYPNADKATSALAALGTIDRADAKAPYETRTAAAGADKAETDAAYAAPKAQADITKTGAETRNLNSEVLNRAERLGLDRDTLESNMQLKVAELRRKPGAIDLPDSAIKIVNESAANSQVSRQSASQMEDLATQIEAADPNSFAGKTTEWLKKATGNQNYVTQLRQEYVRLRAGEVSKLLPPGPASDTDVKNAMAGFLPETADSKQVASFLRGMSKLQGYGAQVEDARGEWANQVGNLGKASRDIQIGDVRVPAGSTFSDFAKQALKPIGAATRPPAGTATTGATTTTTMQRLLDRYGAVPQGGN